MIATSNLGKEYGASLLFEDVSLQLNAGSRYGLVGANGSGKSTFLRILAGDEAASEGSVLLPKRARVGVLRQDRFLDDDAIILDLAMRGDAIVWNAMGEQRRIADGVHGDARNGIGAGPGAGPGPGNTADADATATANMGRIGDLEDLIAAHDGYTLEARASEVLEGLGIPTPWTPARRCRRCRAGSSCACCWRRSWSAASTCCCWTSRPTTSTS